jgi:hypothetical protein
MMHEPRDENVIKLRTTVQNRKENVLVDLNLRIIESLDLQ